MSRRWFGLIVFSLLLTPYLSAQSTTSVTPPVLLAGSSDTQITVKGSGFTTSAVVSVLVENLLQPQSPQNIPTTFIDSSTVQAVIPATLLAASQILLVRVSNAGPPGTFGFDLAVESTSPPVPTLIRPSGAAPGTTVTLNVNGANLLGAAVSIEGSGITESSMVSFSTSLAAALVTVAPNAQPGPRTVTISTLSGSTSTCGTSPCTFTVANASNWTDVTPSALPSFSPGPLVKLLDGRVLMIGGAMEQPGGSATPVPSAEVFDPASLQWSATGSMTNARATAAASLLPDGRVLAVGGSASATAVPAEVYDPASGTWSLTGTMTSPTASKALLLPNGKVFVSYGTATFGAELFDPVSGSFQVLPAVAFPISGYASTELLADGRVLLAGVGGQSRVYDPMTGVVSAVQQGGLLGTSNNTRLLPDGRVLIEAIFGTAPTPFASWEAYDPTANILQPVLSIINVMGSEVLLPDGSVLISGETLGLAGTFSSSTARYDPVHDQLLIQSSALTRPAAPSLLLDDGRAFGIEYRYSAQDPTNSGTFAQIYTPPSYSNPSAVVDSVVANQFIRNSNLAIDVHGNSFLPNSAVSLAGNKLVTLYLGSQHLVAFIPATLSSSLSSGISVSNPGPGGGTTTPLPAGYTATVPLPIPDVETGSIHAGYVVVTGDSGSALPVATLTYGSVSGGIVQSQAAVLPAPLTAATSMAVDVFPGIGRNLGLAIANPGGTAAQITISLSNLDGTTAGAPVTLSIAAGAQVPRFLSDLFPAATIGAAFRGSLSIQSSTPVSIIGLRFSGAEFSTLPVPVSNPAAVPANGLVGGTNAVMFPQFAQSGGWATALDLLNNTPNTITGRVDIFDSNGNPLAILWNGSRQSTFTYSIPPNGALSLSPRDTNGQSPF